MKNSTTLLVITGISFLLAACTSSTPVHVKSPSFKLGEKDGCMTASGDYTKNSDAFKTDRDYRNGWFSGRRNCNRS